MCCLLALLDPLLRCTPFVVEPHGKRFGKRLIANGSKENETGLCWLSCSRLG